MKQNITMIFTFVAGVAVGAAATYKIAETKWQNIADEEIASVTDRFSNREPITMVDRENEHIVIAEERKTPSKPSILDYKSTIEKVGYNTISTQQTRKEEDTAMTQEEDDDDTDIYPISSDEFNTLDDYGTETFYYTRDNYVVDSSYRKLSDDEIKATIGGDPCGRFDDEEDSTYVRNETLCIDYEILLSEKDYNEIVE